MKAVAATAELAPALAGVLMCRSAMAQRRLLHGHTCIGPDRQSCGGDQGRYYRDGQKPTHVEIILYCQGEFDANPCSGFRIYPERSEGTLPSSIQFRGVRPQGSIVKVGTSLPPV